MKTLKTMLLSSVAVAVLAFSPSATAISINDPGVVGTIERSAPADLASEAGYINQLLSMGASAVFTEVLSGPDRIFRTSSTDYNGSVDPAGAVQLNAELSLGVPNPAFTLSVTGFEYVIAKYGSASVVWFLGGADFTLPSNSGALFDGNGISHWSGFGPITNAPDAGTSVLLLGAGLLGIGALRRRLAK
jgi:hypothetical protein